MSQSTLGGRKPVKVSLLSVFTSVTSDYDALQRITVRVQRQYEGVATLLTRYVSLCTSGTLSAPLQSVFVTKCTCEWRQTAAVC